MIRLTITLRTGEAQTFVVPSLPRHWKSWLMHQLPYGTNLRGCSFKREFTTEGKQT